MQNARKSTTLRISIRTRRNESSLARWLGSKPYAPIPEKTSDFLRTTVEACLKEIMRTMSGQFITHNTDNDQYRELYDRHQEQLKREREKGEYAFQMRRDALSKIGLSQVRQHRTKLLEEDVRVWTEAL